jgi:MFS family permease
VNRLKKLFESNISKFYIYSFFGSFFLSNPVYYVYFTQHVGLTLKELMITASFFTIVTSLVEIPAGILADKSKYTRNIVISGVGIFLGSLGYFLSTNIYHVLVSELFWGIGYGFAISGINPFIYQNLKNAGLQAKYNQIKGRMVALELAGLSLSSLIGGFLGKVNLSLPFAVNPAIMLVPLAVALMCKEPEREKTEVKRASIWSTLNYISSNKNLLFLIPYILIVSTTATVSYHFFQPLMTFHGIDLGLFGVIYTLSFLVSGTGSLFSYLFEKFVKKANPFFVISTASLISMAVIGTGSAPVAILGMLLFRAADGLRWPFTSDYINRNATVQNRATITTLVDFVRGIFVAVLLPVMGGLGEAVGIQNVFRINAVILTVGSFILFPLYRNASRSLRA